MKYVPSYLDLQKALQKDIEKKQLEPTTPLYIHRIKKDAYDNYQPILLYKFEHCDECIECETMTVEELQKELIFHINYYKQSSI